MDKYALLLREINKRKEQGIFFYINKIKIHPYSTKQLSYRAVLDSADDKISWSSSNNNIVTVQDGIITSAGVGTVVITAVGGDKYTASCIVEVVSDTEVIEDPTGIAFEEKQINMDVRETRSLVYYAIPERDYPGTITWISSNPYVVSVKDGYVTAFCEGTAEIMALMDGNYYDICQVTVSRKTPLDTSKMSSKVLSQELLSDVIREDNAAKPQITIFAEEDVNQTTKVVNKYGTFKTVAGLVGHAIDIETTSEFAWADISFTISEDALELNKFEDLTVAWYDPVTDSIIPVETQSNTADRILSARVTHFSTYMVINKWVLNKLKDQCTNVMDLYDSKRADVVFILDNKWSESLENVKLNMIKSVEDLDNSLDLNVNLMVINPNGSITNYGWYTNKGKPKYAPDYTDIEKFESMKTLRQLKEDISSIVSSGYSESNYHDGFVTEGSEIFTKAYNQASNLSGFRSKASRYIFGFSEIRAAGFFKAVKNSIMIKDNETYAFIQRNANYIFSKYSSVEGQVGIFNNFSEPISNYIIDTAKESITVFSTAAKLITDSWSTYRRTMGSNIHYFKVINDRYLNLYGICFIDVAAYLAKAAEDEVNTLDLVLEYHIIKMEDGKYKFVVKSGDSLSSVSKIVNGNSKHWPIIQQENNLTSTVIRPGQILDVTRVINDEKIAMAVAEKLATIDELSKYLELTKEIVPGDIEVYNAKEMLEDISKDRKALFNTGNAVPVMDVRNSDGSIDGIWDDKFMDAIDAFLEALNLKEVYYELQTEEERRMMVLHWIKMEKEKKSLYYYPAPKAWYENMPEIPKTDSTYGKITAENKYYCKEVRAYYMRYIYPVEKVMGGDWWKPGINMFSVWAKMMYGVTSDEKGGLVVGTLEGLLIDYPTDLVAGVFQVIYAVLKDPKQTLESIKFLVRALDPMNGGDERDILVTLFVESMKAGIEEFIEGDEYEKGKIIGKYLCDIVTCFIGVVKGVKAGAQLVKELKNAGSLSKLIRAGLNKTAGNLKNSADEIARSIKAAGEAISKIKTASDDFLNYVSGKVVKLRDGLGFRPTLAGVDNAEDTLTILNNSEISNMSKIESIARAAGRLLNIDEIAPDIAAAVKSVKVRGTVIDMMDESGNVLKRAVVPEGYRSSQQLLYKALTGEVDVTKWGYKNASELEEVINNVNSYLNASPDNIILNSTKAGTVYNGIEFDSLGFPIFKGSDLKFEYNLPENMIVASDNAQFTACTKALKNDILEGRISQNMFTLNQLEDIMDEMPRIENLTWHHNQVTGRMQLVPTTAHNVNHLGGNAIWGAFL